MEFRKFFSIENHYREKTINDIRLLDCAKSSWILTEKIHGANFSFWYDGEDFRVGSRNQFVDETFYSCGDVIKRYRDDIIELHSQLCSKGDVLTVYGELYGPGVQKGIAYSTQKDFVVFDVSVNGVFYSPKAVHSFEELVLNLRFVPVISIVSDLNAVLAYNNHFVSHLAKANGINDADNTAEGFIALPYNEVVYMNDRSRVSLKSKDDKWLEKAKVPKTPRKEKTVNMFTHLIEEFVNENRMNNVLSKMGGATQKDFGQVIRNMSNDVLEDMAKDSVIPINWRNDDHYQTIGKEVNQVVSKFLKQVLLHIL